MPIKNTQNFLEQAFQIALAAAKPHEILPSSLDAVFKRKLSGRCLVLGAGKAAASMAVTLEAYADKYWPDAQLDGMVVTRYGHAAPTRYIDVVEASHPVPDLVELAGQQQQRVARAALLERGGELQVLEFQENLGADDLRQRARLDAGRVQQLSAQARSALVTSTSTTASSGNRGSSTTSSSASGTCNSTDF